MARKLKRIAIGKPAILRPVSEIDAERAERLRVFLDWFLTVPGAEWTEGSTDGNLLYCHYTAVPERPEWGKAFCAYRLDQPLEDFQRVVRARDIPPPLTWDHWGFFGLPRESKRAAVLERMGALYHAHPAGSFDRRLVDVAYARIIADLWVAGAYR